MMIIMTLFSETYSLILHVQHFFKDAYANTNDIINKQKTNKQRSHIHIRMT